MADPEDDLHHAPIPEGDPGRRRFLKIATCAIGGGIGVAVAIPAARYLLYPVGRKVVTTAEEPVDVLRLEDLEVGGPPVRVRIMARSVRDAWSTSTDVPLGSAWISRPTRDAKVQVLSSVCPHLGCAVGFDPASGNFRCPCHNSSFAPDGRRFPGSPSERDLDDLPWEIDPEDGTVRVTWIRYRSGGSEKVRL